MNYNERIRNLREDHDYTQKKIAEHLNIAQTTYSDYEHGRVHMPVERLIKLAILYDVDMNYICGVSDQKTSFPTDPGKTNKNP